MSLYVAIDANALITWASQNPGDPEFDRLEALLIEIGRMRGKLIIPTPSWGEFAVKQANAGTWDQRLSGNAFVTFAPFDKMAATEFAINFATLLRKRGSKWGAGIGRALVKFDAQIISIARTQGADYIVSDDAGVHKIAAALKFPAKRIADLPLPQSQRPLFTTLPPVQATPAPAQPLITLPGSAAGLAVSSILANPPPTPPTASTAPTPPPLQLPSPGEHGKSTP